MNSAWITFIFILTGFQTVILNIFMGNGTHGSKVASGLHKPGCGPVSTVSSPSATFSLVIFTLVHGNKFICEQARLEAQ